MESFLKEYHLIDLKGLALLKYKSMGLTENEVLILLILMTLEATGKKVLGYDVLLNYVNLDAKSVDSILVGLVNKKMVSIIGTTISLEDFYKRLVFDQQPPVTNKMEGINLVEAFENEFAKPLTPMELETLKSWKQRGYSDQMILDALKEAALSNVHSFRYIEKILINWSKDGVRRSGKERIEPVEDDEEFVEYKWWEEND